MKMNFLIVFGLICIFVGIDVCAQIEIEKDTIYIDEFNKVSNKNLTLKKCVSDVYYCKLIEYDSIIVYNVKSKYLFGKLKKDRYDELTTILKDSLGVNFDVNETLVFDYHRMLLNYTNYEKYFDTISLVNKHLPNEKTFYRNQKHYIKQLNKCSKRISKKNKSRIIHLYGENYGWNLNFKRINMYEDPKDYFSSLFFNRKEGFKYLILKPNGNYFLKSYVDTGNDFREKDMFHLIKNDDWTSYYNEWEKRKRLLKKSIPKIRIMYDSYYPEDKCF